MIKTEDIIRAINKISPEYLQESWDNSGIQISDSESRAVKRILTCLEISNSIIDEAVEKQVDMIVTHHPLIFSELRKIDSRDVVGNHIIRLIKNNISVYSAHTSFDSAAEGTNQYLAEALKLSDIKPLIPDDSDECCGMGRAGNYKNPQEFEDFYCTLTSVCSKSDIRIAGTIPAYVRRVALCTGAGSEYIDTAAQIGADVYVTGDLKYHEARHAADIGMCVIDAGHYGTEVIFAENMAAQLKESFRDQVEVFISETDINPFIMTNHVTT